MRIHTNREHVRTYRQHRERDKERDEIRIR